MRASWEDAVTERLLPDRSEATDGAEPHAATRTATTLEPPTVEAALDAAVAEIGRIPASGARERLRTLASILRRVLVTWKATPPSASQRSFVWHQVADLLLEARYLRDCEAADAMKGQRLATWFVNKAR